MKGGKQAVEVEVRLEQGREEPKVVILAGEETEEVRRLVEQLGKLRLDPVPVRRKEERLLLPQEAFLRFYTDGKGVSAQTELETFSVPLRLYELEERLDQSRFVRISNGEIINLDRVTAVDLSFSGTIRMTLEGTVYAYVSRRYVKKIKETLMREGRGRR